MKKWLKRLLAAPFVFVAAVVILIEDWLWDDLQRWAAAIGKLPVLRQIESGIVKLSPYASLALFAAPTLLLVPVKLAALFFIAHGRPTLGLLTVIAAKIAGTALVARLFTLTHSKLMRIAWFARLYEWFVAFKARIYAAIKSNPLYVATRRQALRLRAALKESLGKRRTLWRSRWEAARRLTRKWKQS